MKSIFKKILLFSFSGMLCLGLSGCFNNNQNKAGYINFRNGVNGSNVDYLRVSPRKFKHFSIEKRESRYELESVRLGRIFMNNFRHRSVFIKDGNHDDPEIFRLYPYKSFIGFTSTADEANPSRYHVLVPKLHAKLGKHAIEFIDNKRNVVYKLYGLRELDDGHLSSYRLTLIPIRERIDGKRETKISSSQGRHYLVHIKEIEKLASKSDYPHHRSDLPKD